MKLSLFKENSFIDALKALFQELKVPINYITDEPTTAKNILKDTYKDNASFSLIDDVYFVGMVDDAAFEGNQSPSLDKIESDYDGILIFGITLHQRENYLLPSRSQLAEIARAFNREFYYTPVILVFKYRAARNEYIALANTERQKFKQEWREGEKVGKVSLLRDINIQDPHRGHEDIINQLKIPITGKKRIDSFAKLYSYWQEVFSVSILNEKFYQEISNWYFWAIKNVRFPNQPTKETAFQKNTKLEDLIQEHNATNVIRLLTRLLFIWFIKEKNLIPDELFDLEVLQQEVLKEVSPLQHENNLFSVANKESVYYKAILQNLFFATLNCPIEPDEEDKRKRQFRGDESYGKHRGIDWMMRYKKYFKDPDAFLRMVNKVVPFLNGGLFECLDDKTQNLYLDGFSDNMTKGEYLRVPDYLFFGASKTVDLSLEYGVKNKQAKQAAVKGLINILKSYKFTITENTPVEEDVALDPELLGKVFENLLASYNPETKTTARKQTGSFYTPREIVNYMVDESLIAYLKSAVSWKLTDSTKQDALCMFFNPNDEIQIHQGNLPHWEQKNVWYFITFRLADSIPFEKQEQLKFEREQWLKSHKKDEKHKYTKEELKEYYRLFSERVEGWLNNGYGSCVLKNEKNANIVADAFKHFEGEHYILDEWVVMPNHVHVLVKPLDNHKISDILHSWKSFTANEINKNIGKTGQLWMHESYDHIVRNEKAFEAIKNYIRQNPKKANIVPGASSFGSPQSKDALDTMDTMLHQLTSFDNINPFEDYPEISKQIVYALDRAKILDPAAGSGAFPMGMLQKMVHILQKIDPDNEMWKEAQLEKALQETKKAYDIEDKKEREQKLIEINDSFDEQINDPDFARKLYLIENCIYGVDIQPIATQIAKLRFFISLVVEQKVNDEKDNFGIRPLPNLETKFVTANTLIGLEKPDSEVGLFESLRVGDLEKELKHIRHRLFNAKTKATKLKYRKRDEELRNQIAEELQNNGWGNESAKQLASWDPYDQNASSPFFDPEWMFDIKDGFDVVIGNPPYIQLQKAFDEKRKYADLYKEQNFETFARTGDIYALFYEKANEILHTGGFLTYITSNKWMRAGYGKSLRQFFAKYNPLMLIDLGPGVFTSATVDTNILLIQKTQAKQHYLKALSFNENLKIDNLKDNDFVTLSNLSEESWIILSPQEQKIKEHIEKIGTSLKDWDISINYGIKTGYNQAFIIDGKTKDSLIAQDPKSAEIIKPILRGRDIKRYKAEFADLWLIATFPALKLNIDNYPAVKEYLEQFLPKIKQAGETFINSEGKKEKTRKKTGNKWFETQDQISYYQEFEKEKIVYPNMTKYLPFILDKEIHYYHNDKSFHLTGELLYWLLAMFNSKLFKYAFKNKFPELQGGTRELRKVFFDKLPILKIQVLKQKPFKTLVDYIIFLKSQSDDTQSFYFGQIIDGMVYELYFEEEIKKAGCEIIKYLQGLPELKEEMSDSEKQKIIDKVFAELYDKNHSVRRNLYFMDSVEEVKIIKESLEK